MRGPGDYSSPLAFSFIFSQVLRVRAQSASAIAEQRKLMDHGRHYAGSKRNEPSGLSL
jgi:hypothetical protein